MCMIFNIFGSQSSKDWDIMVYVGQIGSIKECHQLVEKNNLELASLFVKLGYPIKKVNSNLGVLNEIGTIERVFKGTPDECNNSVYRTYHLHNQIYPLQLSGEWNRLESASGLQHLKLKRALRAILTFWSRCQPRIQIKNALRNNFKVQLQVAKLLDIRQVPVLKKDSSIDIYKTVAFQLGQTTALFNGLEIYTKEDCYLAYPELEPFLLRQESNLEPLYNFYQNFLQLCDKELIIMKNLEESV